MLYVVVVLLLSGVLSAPLVADVMVSASDSCIQGYVWREAYPGDQVCVLPEVRYQAAADNKLASNRRQAQEGARV